MPRRATGPRYYPSRSAYYVWLQGKQHPLADGPICAKCEQREKQGALPTCVGCKKIRYAADLRFAELVSLAEVDHAEDNALVFALINRYLKWVEGHRKTRTYERAVYFLGSFSEECGHLKVKQLKPIHVDDWLARMATPRTVETPKGIRKRGWGKSSRRMAIDVVQACLNWCKKKRLISKNPIAEGIERPGVVSRTKESLIDQKDHQAMLTALEAKYQPRYYPSKGGYHVLFRNRPIMLAKGAENEQTLKEAHVKLGALVPELGIWEPFAVLLRLLEHTGCRPGELYNATADDWDEALGGFVFPADAEPEKQEGFTHKTARKGKDRVVFVSDPDLRVIVAFFRKKYPAGPILRNLLGEPWTDSAVHWRMDTLKETLKMNPKITPYSYRHTSITNMLLAGQPPALVAEGHGTSVQMIQRHYSHLDGHKKAMATFWAQAKARPTPSATASGGPAE